MTFRPTRFALLAALLLLLAAPAAVADPVADFYKGKNIDVIIALGPGAEYDLQARLLAHHMGAHIPGNPTMVPRNMVGAGGLRMANWFSNVAPRDGTVIGVLASTMPALQAVGGQGVQFDANKLSWLGAFAPEVETMAAWSTKGVRTIEEARRTQLIVGASSPGAISYAFPKMMNEYLGTKFKIVQGFQGVTQMSLGMERGEVDAHANTWNGWKQTHPDWITDKKIFILAQITPKASDLPNVPAVEELARNDDDRRIIDLVVGGNRFGRPFATTPGVPPERVQALRRAFEETMKDPEFLKAAAAAHVEVEPISGNSLQAMIAKMLASPPRVVQAAKPLISP